MIHFAWPWALLLLPLPWLSHRLLPPAPAVAEAALWVPSLAAFGESQQPQKRSGKPWRLLLAILCWLLLVGAAARPQWLGEPLEQQIPRRNIMLAVDISTSMKTQDFRLDGVAVDRLTALKAIAGQFIARRKEDRLGLILFAGEAYVQVPLTFDRRTVQQLLDEAVLGLAGRRTAIGDAIGLAVKRAMAAEGTRHVLLLMTDGANNAGVLTPQLAAELAARQGMTIYTLAMGPDPMRSGEQAFNLARRGVLKPAENSLRRVAQITGGRHFRALDTAQLEAIYAEIDQLEPLTQKPEPYRPVAELYPWPLALSLLCGSLLLLWRTPLGRGK